MSESGEVGLPNAISGKEGGTGEGIAALNKGLYSSVAENPIDKTSESVSEHMPSPTQAVDRHLESVQKKCSSILSKTNIWLATSPGQFWVGMNLMNVGYGHPSSPLEWAVGVSGAILFMSGSIGIAGGVVKGIHALTGSESSDKVNLTKQDPQTTR